MLLEDDRIKYSTGTSADDDMKAEMEKKNKNYYQEVQEGKHDKKIREALRNELKKGNKKDSNVFEESLKRYNSGDKLAKANIDRARIIMKEEQDRDIRLLNSDEQNFLQQIDIYVDDPKKREKKYTGGKTMNILDDDKKRIGYAMGPAESPIDTRKETAKGLMGMGISQQEINILKTKPLDSKEVRTIINRTEEKFELEPGVFIDAIVSLRPVKKEDRTPKVYGGKMEYNEGGSLLADDMETPMMPEEMPEMNSDSDMEENYTRFIMDEALSEEEEDMLVSKLEQDEELQMLFDKVIDVAQEFAGNGPVEGPGTGVSDDIPARLSDGEFVFTAKAVEEIGEDTLMSMMKDAEVAADERQGLFLGGTPDEEEIEDEESNVSNDMRKVNPRLNPNVR